MIYADLKLSLNEDDFLSPMSEQKYNLGEKITINKEFSESLYSTTYMYVRCPVELETLPFLAYRPYMVGASFELDQYDAPYEPNSVDVVCPQFNMEPGEYGFVLYQGEGLFVIENTGIVYAGSYLKAEGDSHLWGYTGFRTGATAGFISVNADRADPVKGVLFGHEVNVSPTV